MYIWATDDQDYDTSIGMNVVSSHPDRAKLIGAEVYNSDIFSMALGAPVDVRWADVSVGDITPGQISNMNASRDTSGTGILAANNGTVPLFRNLDPLYDVQAGAFLLGSVVVEDVGVPATWSTLTINQEGTALFVNNGEQVFPDFGSLELLNGLLISGDINDDWQVNGLDVEPFVAMLLEGNDRSLRTWSWPEEYNADVNHDGELNGLDVDPFVAAAVGDGTQSVPEPSTLLLVLVALGVVGGWRKWRE